MLMVADVGEGGVKNRLKSADVVYGRPLTGNEALKMPRLDYHVSKREPGLKLDTIGHNSIGNDIVHSSGQLRFLDSSKSR